MLEFPRNSNTRSFGEVFEIRDGEGRALERNEQGPAWFLFLDFFLLGREGGKEGVRGMGGKEGKGGQGRGGEGTGGKGVGGLGNTKSKYGVEEGKIQIQIKNSNQSPERWIASSRKKKTK